MTPALELRDVSYLANGQPILRSINWTVLPQEHWAIVGPNGSGKTTLLKLACGYLWPNGGGEIRRRGKLLVDLRELRRSIGWVTSNLAAEIPPNERVLRTVVSGKFAQVGLMEGFGGNASENDFRLAAQLLTQLGCDHLRERDFGVLSQGEQQTVLIARARMTRPYLIVLDEPCAGLDPGARENFLQTLKRLGKAKNIPALIYVTHHIEEILPLFEKVLVLRQGRVVQTGGIRAVLRESLLRELFGVSVKLIRKRGRLWPMVV
ncbi:MAG TPA: ATP-binding cassette domain-containing protein [Candidatus Binatia bacterium]|nr:ATP-binding cassette domain-containing protein [Candidatus Binatia bacterium]